MIFDSYESFFSSIGDPEQARYLRVEW
jgi:hypothetical protein